MEQRSHAEEKAHEDRAEQQTHERRERERDLEDQVTRLWQAERDARRRAEQLDRECAMLRKRCATYEYIYIYIYKYSIRVCLIHFFIQIMFDTTLF